MYTKTCARRLRPSNRDAFLSVENSYPLQRLLISRLGIRTVRFLRSGLGRWRKKDATDTNGNDHNHCWYSTVHPPMTIATVYLVPGTWYLTMANHYDSSSSSSSTSAKRTTTDLCLREQETYKGWTVLGQVDLDGFVAAHVTTAASFEDNFKAVKIKRKEAEKLPETIKVHAIYNW